MPNISILKKAAFAAGILALLLIAVGVFLPATGQVTRSIEIDAPAASVFALVNDFRQINQWSPWIEKDANALYTISGPARGVGATLTWDGQIVGQGSQVIVESEPYSRVASTLDLGSQGDAQSMFDLQKTEAGTQVTWRFENDFGFNLAGRYFGLMLDSIVGPDYEQGLTNLKRMAERLPPADFGDIDIEHTTVDAMDIVLLPASSVPEAGAISAALGDAYFELLGFIDRHDLSAAGAPMSIGASFTGSQLQFNAAIPVRGLPDDLPDHFPNNRPAGNSAVRLGKSYAGPVIRATHIGAYRTLGRTHDKIAAYLAALGIQRAGDAWESYASDPTRVAERELVTYVYYPVVYP